jgi:hypothetical protein
MIFRTPKLIKDFNKHSRKESLKIDYKKICSYFSEFKLIFCVIASAILGTELYHLIKINNPFDLIAPVMNYSLSIFAAYCALNTVTLVILSIRYEAEDAYIPQIATFILATLSKVIGSRKFVYLVSCLLICIDAYFINAYIFYYLLHTVLGFIFHLIFLMLINIYIIGYAIYAALCGLLIMEYDKLLHQRELGYISKFKNN